MLVNKNTDFFRVFTKSVSMDQFFTKKVYEMNESKFEKFQNYEEYPSTFFGKKPEITTFS